MNKRLIKYLAPAIKYGWAIEDIYNGRGYWDGDSMMPVTIGPLYYKAVKLGYLYELDTLPVARPTPELKEFKCKHCCGGKEYDDNDNPVKTCGVCNGSEIVPL